MAHVVLAKAADYSQREIYEGTLSALDALDYELGMKTNLVIIKPNLSYYWDFSTGETTHPSVVSAVIDWVRQRAGKDVSIVVAEADASAMRTKYAFKMLGYEKLGNVKKVKLQNLSEGEIADVEVRVAGERFALPVNKVLLDADLIINVPKLKYHRVMGLTCALKNMFGAISKPRKFVYHDNLPSVIVGMNKIVRSSIVLTDGIIALGKTPKKIGAVLASNDVLAADFIAAKAMGYNPLRIGYLRLGIREKIGNVENIDLTENHVRLEDVRMEFPRRNYLLQKLSWKLQLRVLKIYAKLAGDVVPPVLWES